jgi:hypothetical protein
MEIVPEEEPAENNPVEDASKDEGKSYWLF